MTFIVNLNDAALPVENDPTIPLATGAADGLPGLIATCAFGNFAGISGLRANGTAAIQLPLKKDDRIVLFASSGRAHSGYHVGTGGFSVKAEDDWADNSAPTCLGFSTTSIGTFPPAKQRMQVGAAGGLVMMDANEQRVPGGDPGPGKINAAEFQIAGNSIFAGPTAFAPLDASGAGLAFAGVSVQWERHFNQIFVYGILTYPATASGLAAAITLPVAVPNQGYANAIGAVWASGGGPAGMVLQAQQGTAAAFFRVTPGVGGVANVALTGTLIFFTLNYPAS